MLLLPDISNETNYTHTPSISRQKAQKEKGGWKKHWGFKDVAVGFQTKHLNRFIKSTTLFMLRSF